MIDLEKYLPKKGGFGLKKILVPPGKEVDLEKDFETGYTGAYKDKKEAEVDLAANVLRLADQQDLLFANDTYSLLIVFQALDAPGKMVPLNTSCPGLILKVVRSIVSRRRRPKSLITTTYGGQPVTSPPADKSGVLNPPFTTRSSVPVYIPRC